MIKILSNKIKCNFCGDIIESHNVQDYKVCKCGRCACMGGLSELKRDYVYSHEDYTELSKTIEIADDTEDEVNAFDDECDGSDFSNRSGRKRNKRRKG